MKRKNSIKKILDVGCGGKKVPGSIGIDKVSLPSVDIKHDLGKFPWPVEKNSVDEIHCYHYLEHAKNIIKTMEELYRILKPGGKLIIRVPHYSGRLAWQDPTHRRTFSLDTFDYFTDNMELNYYSKVRFKVMMKRIKYSMFSHNEKWYEKNIRPNKQGLLPQLFINLVQPLIDINPAYYEKVFLYMTGGADELYFELAKPIFFKKKPNQDN